jgi:hypothetical protein
MMQLQLRVELRGIKPLIWRRLLVPETVALPKLHLILQSAMGWSNSHLHEYEIDRQRYGVPDGEWPDDPPLNDEKRVRLKPLIDKGLRRFTYLYDFGDGWEHLVKVEDLLLPKPGMPFVLCTAGENACPPEDVGGPHGYGEFLAILKDPRHEEHADMLRWIGGAFDPTRFNIAAANALLTSFKA